MIAVVRGALLAALVAGSSPVVAQGQKHSADSLAHRIVQLERKAAELEQRIRELEALNTAQPARERPLPTSANWRDSANWRRLRRGMNMEQVRAILGEPERVDATSILTIWTYGRLQESASVRFEEDGLTGWSEPRR